MDVIPVRRTCRYINIGLLTHLKLMAKIKIILENKVIKASLNNKSNIGKAIYNMLPITSRINTWGDELYFPLNLNMQIDLPITSVSLGDIAYSELWKAFCVFYGKTPISNKNEIIPNSPVEVIGRIDEDPLIIKKLLSGYFTEKRRRISNRIPILRRFAETITLEKFWE